MKLLLTGASGFIGGHLRRALAGAGHEVVAVSRRDGHDMMRMTSPVDWLPLLDGVDAAINAAGLIGQTRTQRFATLHTVAPVALFRACAIRGVRRVLQVSALGADAQAFSRYHLSKRAADDALRALPLEWIVLRPSLVHGPGGASARLFGRLAALPRIPVVGDGLQPVQPLHVADLVDALLRALADARPRCTLDLVGPETLGFADWLRRLRAAQGLAPAPLLRVPPALALAGAALGGLASPLLRAENLRMLQAGRTADPAPLEQWLGRRLRPALATWPGLPPAAAGSAA